MNSSKVVPEQDASQKRTYRSPQLLCYGDVALITKGGKGTGGDAGGPKSKHCWVAEVLYGVDAPRTEVVRAWLTECYDRREPWALIAVPLYQRFGRRVASLALRYSFVANVFRPLFDLAVRRSHREYAAKLLAETAVLAAR